MSNRGQAKKSIFFRVDGGYKIGLGHVVRSINLAKELARNLNCCIAFTYKNDLSVTRLINKEGFLAFPLTKDASFEDESRLYQDAEVIITDSPLLQLEYLFKLRKKTKFMINMIEENEKAVFPGDIIINPNLYGKVYYTSKRNTRYFYGNRYLILNRKYIDLRKRKKKIKKKAEKVLICFGGSDPKDITRKAIRILINPCYKDRAKMIVVVGQAYKKTDDLKKWLSGKNNFKVKAALPDLAEEFYKADAAVLSGGTLMYEACTLGIPSLIICQNDSQHKEARILHRYRAVINAGLYDDFDELAFRKAFERILNNTQARKHLYQCSRRLIDPYGAERIADLIVSGLESKLEK